MMCTSIKYVIHKQSRFNVQLKKEEKKICELFFKQFVILFIEIHNNKGFIKISVVVTD